MINLYQKHGLDRDGGTPPDFGRSENGAAVPARRITTRHPRFSELPPSMLYIDYRVVTPYRFPLFFANMYGSSQGLTRMA